MCLYTATHPARQANVEDKLVEKTRISYAMGLSITEGVILFPDKHRCDSW